MFKIQFLSPILSLLILKSPNVGAQGLVIKTVLEQPLTTPGPNVVATELELYFPPGDVGSPPHYHSGPLIGYVVEGDFLLQLKDEPLRIVRAGCGFYEMDRAIHIWGANASNRTACKVVVTLFGRPGEAPLTIVPDFPRQTYEKALAEVGL